MSKAKEGDEATREAAAATLFHNPALYRQLSEPFPTVDAADAAINGFNTELRALRAKYKLPDVHVIMMGSCIHESGEEGHFMLNTHHGDASRAEIMTAWALGKAQAERQEQIGRVLTPGTYKRPLGGK